MIRTNRISECVRSRANSGVTRSFTQRVGHTPLGHATLSIPISHNCQCRAMLGPRRACLGGAHDCALHRSTDTRSRCYTHLLRPQRACPVGEGDGVAKRGNRENTDPHVLVTWVKEIRRLCGRIGVAGPSPSPSGRAGWGRLLLWSRRSRSILFTIRARRMGSRVLCIATRHEVGGDRSG